MFTLWGSPRPFCDRVHRRDFLRSGTLGVGGLTLADVFRLRAQASSGAKPRAVIMVCLAGGPSHIDMYDLKPDAPVECRGEFKPIKTNVPGFDICEHMPLQARIADKLALVRTVQYVEPMQHELHEVHTGFTKAAKRPAFGSIVSHLKGADRQVPAYVSLEYSEGTTAYESPEYVGAAHRPLHVSGGAGVHNLGLHHSMNGGRLAERRTLLESFDQYRRELDVRSESQDFDAHTARAFDVITSSKAREAFDLSREPDKVRERYGNASDKYTYVGKTNDSVWGGEKFLLARRLVEAGVSVVTLRVGQWDHHGNVIQSSGGVSIFHSLRTVLPMLDRSIHALVTDLHERGLDKEVAVVVWGEMGRTPIVEQAGRHHWMDAGYALFAGAVKTGQVIGATDSRAERPKQRAVSSQAVLATLYHTLGIDPSQTLPDFAGRPQHILDESAPIAELV